MKKIFLILALTILFFNKGYAASGEGPATEYIVQMEKLELCEDSACATSTTVGDSKMKVNIASVSGHSGLAGMADYNSAKAAMLSLTKTLAADFAPDNIRVNAVNPALIHTPLWEKLANDNFVGTVGDSVDEVFANLSKQMLMIPRYGKPEEVADVTTFLASERASFVTGACWNVDGGFTKFII